MLVIVYLQDAKCYTIVPEEFIYSLDERSLKNNGLNRNQNRLIFFSREWFEKMDQNESIDQEYKPNFHRPITGNYPLPDDLNETCFIGRMIHYEGKCIKKMLKKFFS